MSLMIQSAVFHSQGHGGKGMEIVKKLLGAWWGGGARKGGGDWWVVIPNSCLAFPIYCPVLS